MPEICVPCLLLEEFLEQLVSALWMPLACGVIFGGIVALIGAYSDLRIARDLFVISSIAAIVGFVIGNLAGASRDAAIPDLLPAIMSLMGTFFVYLLVTDKVREARFVGIFLVVFALALLFGANWGATVRVEAEMAIAERLKVVGDPKKDEPKKK